jgi:HK97 family phage major capsid protein
MSKKLIEKLRAQRDADRAGADSILSKIEAGTELSTTEQTNLDALVASATELDARIASLSAMEMARIEAENLDAKLDGALATRASATFQINEPAPDLASRFTESDAFKRFAETPSGNSSIMHIDEAIASSQMAVATAVVTGSLPPRQRTSDVQNGIQKTPLLDACGYEPVQGNSLEWIEWPIDPVGTVTAENVTKTEATYTPVLRTGTLEKIAHHLPFTREVLEDVPRFQAMVNGALLRGVRRKAETQAAAALIAATLPSNADGKTLTEAIRLGMAEVETAGFTADTVVVNPFDYAQIDIDLLGATLNGARVNGGIWNVNIVPATAVTAGTAYVGDFATGMTLFDRRNLALYMTDSHAAEFADNVLRVLAEARMKAVVVMPAALCEVTVATP